MSNTSIEKVLRQIIAFKKDVVGALEILNFEKSIDSEKIKILSNSMNILERKKDFQEVLDFLNIFEIMLITTYIFIDFDILSVFLVYFNSRFKLNDNDRKNIIFELVKRNINNGILDDSTFIINKEYLFKYQNLDNIKVSELKKISGFTESSEILTKDIQEYHRVIKECYFDKRYKSGELRDFNFEDIKKIEGALLGLNINYRVVESTIRCLEGKVKVESNYEKYNKVKEKKKGKLSKKEYYEIDLELRKYFYFDNSVKVNDLNNSIMIYRSLSEKEKMRCVFLLRKGGYDVSTIETFLRKAEIINLNNNNFLDLYNSDFKYMFDYYRNEYNFDYLFEEIEDIVTILSLLEIGSLEYFEWVNELRRLVSNVCDNISFDQKKAYVFKKIKDYVKKEKWV